MVILMLDDAIDMLFYGLINQCVPCNLLLANFLNSFQVSCNFKSCNLPGREYKLNRGSVIAYFVAHLSIRERYIETKNK